MQPTTKEFILHSSNRDFLCDVRFVATNFKKPVLIFIHGFKGFKDWGHFNLISDFFAQNNFVVVKLNLSHNGTTPKNPFDFVDLEAFGNNTFSKELNDLDVLINEISNANLPISIEEYSNKNISLIGHSRGGGLALLKAGEDKRVQKVITLATIHDLSKRWPQSFLDEWKIEKVKYVYNGRTEQNMPLYYQLVEDFHQNKDRLDIPEIVKKLSIPILAFHGTEDTTLEVDMAHELASWNSNIQLNILKGANHVFGGCHPFTESELPKDTLFIIENSLTFLNS